MNSYGLVKGNILALFLACFLSFAAVIAVTGLVSQTIIRFQRKKEYEKTRARLLSNTEEGLYFYRRTAITADVISWVRGFGAEVKVKKPVWLAAQLKNEAKQILEKY